MARPHKSGLEYFPHDTHPDKKLERFFLLYEAKGKSFWYTMLEEIYSEGWSLSIADSETVQILSKKAFVTVQEWNLMLATALKLDLFDIGFYEQQMVLTSNGIKRRWEVVAQKRLRNAEYYDRNKQRENEFRTAETPAETTDSAGFHLRAKEKESKEDHPSDDQIPPTPEVIDSKAEEPRRKGRAKSPRMICPEDFLPTPRTREWCQANGHPEPTQAFVDDFVNYWRNRGDLGADWQAAFRNYMAGPFRLDKKEAKYGADRKSAGQYATAQQQKDKRLLEVAGRIGRAPRSNPGPDSPALRIGAEGNPLG